MCYDIKASIETQLKRARRKGDREVAKQISTALLPLTDLPLYHSNGFNHPKLFIYTNRSPHFPEPATWGLVPFWVKDRNSLSDLWNKTLNARGETIFEKPAFRDSARNKRCLIYVDGFYEHQHVNGKTYPFFISKKNREPLILGGLWSEWRDEEKGEWLITFSIVTTKGNSLLAKIHNSTNLKGPRMPLIFNKELGNRWLENIDHPCEEKILQEIIAPYPEGELTAHTVKRLRGKNYPGNIPGISDYQPYPELEHGTM